jgi:hypothetical protein
MLSGTDMDRNSFRPLLPANARSIAAKKHQTAQQQIKQRLKQPQVQEMKELTTALKHITPVACELCRQKKAKVRICEIDMIELTSPVRWSTADVQKMYKA